MNSLLERIQAIKQVFGTLTDKMLITPEGIEQADGFDIWPTDLQLFKYMVENGAFKSAEFKPPNGYKILDFLTLLSHLQDEKRQREWQAEQDELNRLFKTMPVEAQNEFRVWLKKPHIKISFSQTVQIFKSQ